jgi:hypothetical protein
VYFIAALILSTPDPIKYGSAEKINIAHSAKRPESAQFRCPSPAYNSPHSHCFYCPVRLKISLQQQQCRPARAESLNCARKVRHRTNAERGPNGRICAFDSRPYRFRSCVQCCVMCAAWRGQSSPAAAVYKYRDAHQPITYHNTRLTH